MTITPAPKLNLFFEGCNNGYTIDIRCHNDGDIVSIAKAADQITTIKDAKRELQKMVELCDKLIESENPFYILEQMESKK